MDLSVIFNVPNIIGIIRILLLYASIFFDKYTFVILYATSAGLDALDGKMARRYNQCTFLGSCFDMITDRSSTIIIFMKIVENSMKGNKFLMLTILTDILSHFLYFSYAITLRGHHKKPDNMLLRIYYKKNVLLVLCTATELFFIALYMSTYDKLYIKLARVLSIASIVKTFFHIVQMYVAICGLSMHESKSGEGVSDKEE